MAITHHDEPAEPERVRLVLREFRARQAGDSEPNAAGEYGLCCWCVEPQSLWSHLRTLWHLSQLYHVRYGAVRCPRPEQPSTAHLGRTPPRLRERRGHRRRS